MANSSPCILVRQQREIPAHPLGARAGPGRDLFYSRGETPALFDDVARVARGAPAVWLQTRLPTPAAVRAVTSALAVANAGRTSPLRLDGPEGESPADAAQLDLFE